MTTTPRPDDGVSGPPAIELRSLVKCFPARRGSQDAEVRAVDGIDLRIEPGEVVAVLGPNGAGKTTTLDMVLGLGGTDIEIVTAGLEQAFMTLTGDGRDLDAERELVR